ncbi:MAG: hypothetical protein IKN57_10340 [Parasporobacterium sp.]|jgi:hypothetical protein|uniref:Uncharacterized protein n=1 Tax=Succiniclasticum ruminis DSM 9236 TaxID=1123323 RepID=A0A1I1XEF2_9FIRM|nr:hypothetical protein [Succiniclasticum ruminis]MBQ3365268.1 hypothetical protein [Acidaminococcaceae bacterium]MBR3643895.1 hypothetical protein [Parasporobacterium sp.]SFE05769.1 hypothetical protein SAMN05216245_101208 [Succiniclasticum ruminis DSM 9236]
MIDISTVPPAAVTGRLFTVFFLSFFIIFITARLVGSERKALWFKRRTNYTLLNRRGIFGEYMNFGYPRTWQGLLVALAMYGLIFALAIGYICFYPYA